MNLIMVVALLLAQDYPARTGLVNDFAGELDHKTKTELHEKLVAMREGGKGRMVVVTVKSLGGQSIEDYAHGLLKKWGIGTKEENDGILLIHAPAERKIRIETGYGMEARLPDITAKRILSTKVTPRLKANQFNEALLAGVDAVTAEVSAPEAPKEQAIKEQAVKSSGGVGPIGWMLMGLLCFAFFAIILWASGVFTAGASARATVDSRIPIMGITVAMAAAAAAAAGAKRRAESEAGIPNSSGMDGLMGLPGVAGLGGIQGPPGISGTSMLHGALGSPGMLVPPAMGTQFPSTHFKPATPTPKPKRRHDDGGSSYSSPSRSSDDSSSGSSSSSDSSSSSSDSSFGGGDSGGGGASDSY